MTTIGSIATVADICLGFVCGYMQPDEDGCLHCGPFTIEDAAAWAARLLDDESEALD
jgi:hypothetical protein